MRLLRRQGASASLAARRSPDQRTQQLEQQDDHEHVRRDEQGKFIERVLRELNGYPSE